LKNGRKVKQVIDAWQGKPDRGNQELATVKVNPFEQPGAEQNQSVGINRAARGQQKNEAMMRGLEKGHEADSQPARTGA
jgi:hypothetical protein